MKLPIFLAVSLIGTLPAHAAEAPALLGIPAEFILFALTLLGVALFHHHSMVVALSGLFTIVLYKLLATSKRRARTARQIIITAIDRNVTSAF